MEPEASPVRLLGASFRPLSRPAARDALFEILDTEGANIKVYTPNAQILFRAHRSPELSRLLQTADLLLPDGVGVTLAARLRGTPLPARLPGIDMAQEVLSRSAKRGLRVYLLGGRPGVAEEAARVLRERFEGLHVCGVHHGYFDKSRDGMENQRLLTSIRAVAPHVLFVCLGFPAQERWIAENTPDLPSLRLSMGLGGSLDVWSGRLRRAPRAFRLCGMEWLWRAMREPRRLGELYTLPAFLWLALTEPRSP